MIEWEKIYDTPIFSIDIISSTLALFTFLPMPSIYCFSLFPNILIKGHYAVYKIEGQKIPLLFLIACQQKFKLLINKLINNSSSYYLSNIMLALCNCYRKVNK